MCNTDFQALYQNRKSKGGGVALLVKNNLEVIDKFNASKEKSFELIGCKIKLDHNKHLWCWPVYIPPISKNS